MSFFDTDRVEKSGKYPSRPFFWGILFAFRKQLCTALVQEVMDAKLMKSEQLQHASQNLNFSKVWVEKLLEHPMANTQGKYKWDCVSFELICFRLFLSSNQPAVPDAVGQAATEKIAYTGSLDYPVV